MLKQYQRIMTVFLCLGLLVGCSTNSSSKPTQKKGPLRDNTPHVLVPSAPGTKTLGNQKCLIDISCQEEGYIIVRYLGDNPKVKFRIKNPNESDPYTYDITSGDNVYPLTGGNGNYTFTLYENISANKYATAYNESTTLTIKNDYITYLYPNQFVNFNQNSQTVLKGEEIAKGSYDDIDVVSKVFDYVINNITYDDDKAKKVINGQLNGYIPQVDEILQSKKGICFDYAAVMASMLRSQNIPTRMLIGYAKTDEGSVYHSWLGVYIKDKGWVDDLIEFNGKNWSMMDPTMISENPSSDTIRDFTTNKKNYITKYRY